MAIHFMNSPDYYTDATTRPNYNIQDNSAALAQALGYSPAELINVMRRGVDPTAQLEYRNQLANQMAGLWNNLNTNLPFQQAPQWDSIARANQWRPFADNMRNANDYTGATNAATEALMGQYRPILGTIGRGLDATTAAGAGAAAGGGYYSARREAALAQQEAQIRQGAMAMANQNQSNWVNSQNQAYNNLMSQGYGSDVQRANLDAAQFYNLQQMQNQSRNAALLGILNNAYSGATDFSAGAGMLSRVSQPFYRTPVQAYDTGGTGMSGFGNGLPAGYGGGGLTQDPAPPGPPKGNSGNAAATAKSAWDAAGYNASPSARGATYNSEGPYGGQWTQPGDVWNGSGR